MVWDANNSSLSWGDNVEIMAVMKKLNHAAIIAAYEAGLAPREIIERLGLDCNLRSVQRIVAKAGVARPHARLGRLDSDGFGTGPFRSIIDSILAQRGHDAYLCAQCGKRQEKKCDLHHRRYEGATIDDLEYVCRSCNLSPHNVGLA